jgi:hypothetical protein
MERGLQKVAVVQLVHAQRQSAWFFDLAELAAPRQVTGTPVRGCATMVYRLGKQGDV